jgi:hypothetical protein
MHVVHIADILENPCVVSLMASRMERKIRFENMDFCLSARPFIFFLTQSCVPQMAADL